MFWLQKGILRFRGFHQKLQTRIYICVAEIFRARRFRDASVQPASVMSYFQRHLNFYVISGLCPRPDPYQEIDIDLGFLDLSLISGNVGSQIQISNFFRLISKTNIWEVRLVELSSALSRHRFIFLLSLLWCHIIWKYTAGFRGGMHEAEFRGILRALVYGTISIDAPWVWEQPGAVIRSSQDGWAICNL